MKKETIQTKERTDEMKDFEMGSGQCGRQDLQNSQAQPEALRKMADVITKNPFAGYIGIELLDIAPGYARARIHIEPKHKNIYGAMHGGCAFSLADTLAGMAVAAYGDYVTTLDASMNYMRPVADTEYLYCEAKVLRNGAKISVIRTELTNDDGKLLIDGSFTYYHLHEK